MSKLFVGSIIFFATVLASSADRQHPILQPSASDDFAVFRHPEYPTRALSKRNDGWCDGPAVRSWSGYLDSLDSDSHLFFYYFESRAKPQEDPVVLWINGGPGCSSSMGLLMELGPCQIVEEGPLNGTASTKINPHSWNSNANLLFLDQPVQVGFSYADHNRHVSTTEKAATDVREFITLFFETFDDLKGRPFHMAGESYGGRYLPVFAGAIVDHNKKAVAGGYTPINLASVLIGNGLTDELTAIPTYWNQACTNISGALTGPVLDVHTCARMQSYVPRCEAWLNRACVESHDAMECKAAHTFCSEQFMGPYFNALWNPYDVSKACPSLHEDLCYPVTTRIANLLDQPAIRKQLGVPDDSPPFQGCNMQVNGRFHARDDDVPTIDTFLYVTALLERGVDILIYNGKFDWICNWLSNKVWLDRLVWSGAQDYLAAEMRPWHANVRGHEIHVGDTKHAYSLGGGKLTFATLERAGHMVPYDQPEAALTMLSRTLARKHL